MAREGGTSGTPKPLLPTGVRPRAYAAAELVLDIMYIMQKWGPLDLETILIYFCVVEATMRPLLIGPQAPLDLIDLPRPPEELRGSISRRAIADRTGLARETVRRKVLGLVDAGLVLEDSSKRVRAAQNLDDPRIQEIVASVFAAVQSYGSRIEQFEAEPGRPVSCDDERLRASGRAGPSEALAIGGRGGGRSTGEG